MSKDFRESYLSQLKTWAEGDLEEYAEHIGGEHPLGAGLLLHLSDALKRLSYNNLGDLIRGAEAANHLSPMLTESKRENEGLAAQRATLLATLKLRDDEIEELKTTIRGQDAGYTRLHDAYQDAVRNVRLLTEEKEALVRKQVKTAKLSLRTRNDQRLHDLIWWGKVASALEDALGYNAAEALIPRLMRHETVEVEVPEVKTEEILELFFFGKRVK